MYRFDHRKNASAAVAVAIDAQSLNRSFHRHSLLWMLTTFLALAFVVFVLPAQSATYYVATTGNDSAAGTSSTPWRTINHGVPLLKAGDVMIIRDGTYKEYVDLDLLAKASPAITIQAENPRKAIIDPGNDYSIGIGAWQPVQGVRLIGLKIASGKMGICFYRGGDGMDVINCEVSGGIEGIRIPDGSNLKIQDCYIHDNNQGVLLGVKDSSGVSNILIERVVAANNSYDGTGNTDGFAVEGMCNNLVIRDCVSYGAGDSGFDIKPSDAILERVLSYNNDMGIKLWGSRVKLINAIVYGNKNDGIATAGDSLEFWNCTIANNAVNGIRLETSNPGSCLIRNTIFYNNPLRMYSSNMPNDNYNCYYSTSGGYVIRTASTTYTHAQIASGNAPVGSNTRGHDPLFTNAGTANFRLASGSMCIGAGVASSLVTVDYYGTTRQNPPDKGAIAATSAPTVIPTAPTVVSITPSGQVGTDTDLVAQATGSTVSNGSTISYQYNWAVSTNGGSTWGAWGNAGATLGKSNLSDGQMWKARARATVDNTNYSTWTESTAVTVVVTATTIPAPTDVTVTPAQPGDDDNLTASASGGGATGTTPTYEFQWSKSTDGGSTWGAWGNTGSVYLASNTAAGDKVRARARVVAGSDYSDYTTSTAVTIGSATTNPLLPPREVRITPTSPQDDDDLLAAAFGGGNGDSSDTYQMQWAKSTNGGSTWSAWGWASARLAASNTTPGDTWKARARVSHLNVEFSDWTESAPVTIAGATATPVAPTSVVISPTKPGVGVTLTATASPTAPAGITYQYQWRKCPAGSRTWGQWTYNGQTVTTTAAGEKWQARARATNGTTTTKYKNSTTLTVTSSGTLPAATKPTSVTITPSAPYVNNMLTATASPTAATGITYRYQWRKSTNGGSTWSAWANEGQNLSSGLTAAGEKWQARACATNGSTTSSWTLSSAVTIQAAVTGNVAPNAPTVTITPSAPTVGSNLTGNAVATDANGDALEYEFYWARSTDGGQTWEGWNYYGKTLAASNTSVGDHWKVRSRAHDGKVWGAFAESAPVTIK